MNVKNKTEITPLLILTVFCFFIFFAFLGSYPLIDVDETRYVRIAQEMLISNNFLTPMINGEIFLEKPPLFFWLEDFSLLIFGINEWGARIPTAIIATVGVFFTYFIGKKFVSNRFGLFSALILGSNVLYIALSHIAILDMLLAVTTMISSYLGIMTLYTTQKENKLQWIGFYIFCGLATLAKGLPGFIIPFGIVFLAYFFSKRLKELFDFKKISTGLIILSIIVLPWHIMMIKTHGQSFIDEYIIKHHFARFINSTGINRKEPWWFFIYVIIIGFIPFSVPLITTFINEIHKCIKNFKAGFSFNLFKYFSLETPANKRFLSINLLAFLFIFILFSISSTKLPTYILPATFPLAFIIGYIFEEYNNSNKFELQIKISNIILTLISGIIAIAGIIILYLEKNGVFLNLEITQNLRIIIISCVILLCFYTIFNTYQLIKKLSHKYFFNSTIIFMVIGTIILNLLVFNYITNLGQNELIRYAKYAQNNNQKLATFNFGYRYSTIFYYGKNIAFEDDAKYEWFKEKLNDNYIIIVKNKDVISMPSNVRFEIIQSGKKYSLVKKTGQ